MISLAYIYEEVFDSVEIKSVKEKSFPPKSTDGTITSVKSKDVKGEDEKIVVKPDDDEAIIIRRKKK